MPESDAAARVEVELSRLLRRGRRVSDDVASAVHPDLRAGDYALLRVLAECGPTRSGELAARLGLDKSTTSRLTAGVVELGLVRSTVDDTDARARLVELTGEGRRRFDAVRAERRAQFAAYLATWEAADLAVLADLLGRLNTDLDD